MGFWAWSKKVYGYAKPIAKEVAFIGGILLCMLGGADLAILALAPDSKGEIQSRGIAAFVPALLAVPGFTIGSDIAIRNLPLGLLIGFIWGGIVLFLDVSLLKGLLGASTWRKVGMVIFRGSISAAAALAISKFILLGIFSAGGDIGPQVDADQRLAAQSNYTRVIEPRYAADIAAANATIAKGNAAIQQALDAVSRWQTIVDTANQLTDCELNGNTVTHTCPQTSGQVGAGANYKSDLNQLHIDQAHLKEAQQNAQQVQGTVGPETTRANATLATIATEKANDKTGEFSRQLADKGLIPRLKALGELRAKSFAVDFASWVIEILLILADMSAVIAALFSCTPTYTGVLESMRKITALDRDREESEAQSKLDKRVAVLEAELEQLKAGNAATLEKQGLQLQSDSDPLRDQLAQSEAARAQIAAQSEREVARVRQETGALVDQANQESAEAQLELARLRGEADRARAEADADVKLTTARADADRIKLLADAELHRAKRRSEIRQLEAQFAAPASPSV